MKTCLKSSYGQVGDENSDWRVAISPVRVSSPVALISLHDTITCWMSFVFFCCLILSAQPMRSFPLDTQHSPFSSMF